MNVLSLPVELIDGCILPLLGWNDLLRLRRTCKAANNLVKDYIRRHPDKAPELEIGMGERGLRPFVAMDIRTRKVFLVNKSGRKFYSAPTTVARRFMEDYIPKVTNLHLNTFSMQCSEEGRQFLERFVNLTSFTTDKLQVKPGVELNLPHSFQQIRELNLNWTINTFSSRILEEILMNLPSLESVKVSIISGASSNANRGTQFRSLLQVYISAVKKRSAAVEGLAPLKTIDCGEWLPGFMPEVTQVFRQLCSTCAENNVQLSNVLGEWIDDGNMDELTENQRMQLGLPLISLTSYWFPDSIRILPMPNLEKLVIYRSYAVRINRELRCNLPKLKHLDITIFGSEIANCRYFFQDVNHEALTELNLTAADWVPGFVPFLANHLPGSCPNLKKLSLRQLSGNCGRLVSLWEGLAELEEVSLIWCQDLGDASFIGADVENPAFLNLTKLKKLTLGNLDWMPNITDALFTKVISQMSLTHLVMWGDKEPLTFVTMRGITSLLEGPFAESIEKFSFEGWKLKRVSKERFKALEARFRCKDML